MKHTTHALRAEHAATTHDEAATGGLRTKAPEMLAFRPEAKPLTPWSNLREFLGDLIGGLSIFAFLFVFLYIGWAFQ